MDSISTVTARGRESASGCKRQKAQVEPGSTALQYTSSCRTVSALLKFLQRRKKMRMEPDGSACYKESSFVLRIVQSQRPFEQSSRQRRETFFCFHGVFFANGGTTFFQFDFTSFISDSKLHILESLLLCLGFSSNIVQL